MIHNDFDSFKAAWLTAHAVSANNKQLSDEMVSFAFEVLSDFSLENIARALVVHARAEKFAPTPSDVVKILSGFREQHLGPEEAWAIALESFDETRSVVWTEQIQEARNVSWLIYESGDKVGARMAFREVYARLSKDVEPKWKLSQGYDKEQKAEVVSRAVEQGRLTLADKSRHVIAPATVTTKQLIDAAQNITGKVDALAKIRLIKTILDIDDDDSIAARESERLAFESHRSDMIDKASALLSVEVH